MSTPTRILMPTDFSAAAKVAFNYALEVARSFGASIDLLHSCEPPPMVAPAMLITIPGEKPQTVEDWIAADARRQLDAFLAAADKPKDVQVRSHVVIGGPRASILDFVAAHKSEMIVMGTHGRTGLTHLVLGSVAEAIVRTSPVPVLTVRGPKS